ncbi:MAG: hypothetical protein AB7E39_07570 [Endomicrobiaceae bacterium]
MITILTGLPSNKNADSKVCRDFSVTAGIKAICGSSTMKMYCRELNIIPKIDIINGCKKLPEASYKIEGIDFACEGVITLNQCYSILSGKIKACGQAAILANLLMSEKNVHFIVGSADNKEYDIYMKNNLLPRKQITDKIAAVLNAQTEITFV